MGNCISLTCFDCGPTCNLSPNVYVGEEIGNILCPRRAAESLEEEMDELRAIKVDLERKINRRIRKETPEVVKNWIAKVNKHDSKVKRILEHLKRDGSSSRLHGGLCCCICSKYSLGCDVKKELEVVKRLRSEGGRLGVDNNLVENMPSHLTHNDELPERLPGNKIIVGIKETKSEVFKCLKDDEVDVIGIHGMGGVGKTTLINQVINRLRSSSAEEPIVKFESIISVVVSQNVDVRKIQEDIAIELGLSENEKFKDQDEGIRARFLSAELSERKFLLVLDDMWKHVDLGSIGIPSHHHRLGNKCKVILTTREAKVCVSMGANKRSTVRVDCLDEEDSWELFQKTVGWDADEFESKGIFEIAREIARKCSGLPLILLTVARAMSIKETIQEWRNARETLKNFPHEMHGMDHVFGLLKFSHDNLKEDKHRHCLRYSALFPEDREINIEKMVEYCIGGGSVDSISSSSDIISLRTKGRNIVSELIDACLLERGRKDDTVKVHDSIRDMLLNHLKEQKTLSDAGKGLEGVFNIDEILWRDASMVSLAFNYIREVVLDHENLIKGCNSNMQVLLLNYNSELKKLPRSLFEYFPNLRVLDLSETGLEEIPASLCSLKSLQYLNLNCTGLEEIPASLCWLKSLQYLNLSWTKIKALPKEMGNLTNLMLLDLSDTHSLCKIPSGVLSSLSKLQSLNLFRCGFFSGRVGKEKLEVLKEVDGLPLLKDVGLSFYKDPEGVKFLLDESNMLSKSTITKLHISGVDLISHGLFQRIGSRSKKLECLHIDNFLEEDKEEELVIDEGHFMQLKRLDITSANSLQRIIIVNKDQVREQLTHLFICDCNGLRDLTCLWQLPNLKRLFIHDCNGIVEVVPPQPGGDGDESHWINYHHGPFLKLQQINLCYMKSLVRISSSPLSLRSLFILLIEDCPSLKELSIVPSNSQNIMIRCQKEWWEDIERADGAPPLNFKPYFPKEEGRRRRRTRGRQRSGSGRMTGVWK